MLVGMIGVGGKQECALRPIISINLETSGFKLVLNDGNDGAEYKLTKE